MNNIWTAIKDKIERESGYRVISPGDEKQSIGSDEIVLLITQVRRSSYENVYEVHGDLALRHSHMCNWQVLTDLLDLGLSGSSAGAVMSTYADGFTAMTISFIVQARKDKDRQFAVEEIQYETNQGGH